MRATLVGSPATSTWTLSGCSRTDKISRPLESALLRLCGSMAYSLCLSSRSIIFRMITRPVSGANRDCAGRAESEGRNRRGLRLLGAERRGQDNHIQNPDANVASDV